MSASETDSGRSEGDIASPVQSIEAINKSVGALFAYRGAKNYRDIAVAVNMHPVTVSQALSASRDIGLTQLAGKRGLYVLTKDGQEYSRLLTAGKVQETQVFLNRLIQTNAKWAEVVRFLQATKGQKRDPLDIVLDVERKLGKQWSQTMRLSVRGGYLSILTYALLVRKEGDSIVSTIEELSPVQTSSEQPIQESAVRSTASPPQLKKDFARLQSDDFLFEVRKDANVIEFVRGQVEAWLNYVKSTAEAEASVKEQ